MPNNTPGQGLSGKDRLKIAAAIVLVGLVLFAVLAAFRMTVNSKPENKILVNGSPFFWAGVNYPWRGYQDFGTGAWGHSGVSQEMSYSEIDTDYTNMAAEGVKIAKWRLFNDGRYSPEFDKNGFATGFDEKFLADLDAALAIAEKHDVYLVLSLFSSGLWTTDCEKEGIRFGLGSTIMTDQKRREALFQNALLPLLKHIGANPRILAYEIIAEPDWGVQELYIESDFRQKVPLASARSFVKESSDIIHAVTGARTTVESNRPRNMKAWQGLGLDFYTFSWYDWMYPYDPLDVPADSYGLDKPIVLGEFPAANSTYYSLTQYYDIAYSRGYAGAFAWSYAGGDKHSDWPVARESYVSWVNGHWGEVNVVANGAAAPSPNVAAIPRPYIPLPPDMVALTDTLSVNLDVQIRNGGTYVLKTYLYPLDGNPQDDGREHVVSLADNGHLLANLDFSGVIPNQNYKLSLAIFDPSYNMLKWIDGYARLRIEEGTVKEPVLTPEALENPCYQVE